jgi:hypothetical protein
MDDTDLAIVDLNTEGPELILSQFWRITRYRANCGISVMRERGIHVPADILRVERRADLGLISTLGQCPEIGNTIPQFALFWGEVDNGQLDRHALTGLA